MVDLTREEREVTLAALENLISRHEELLSGVEVEALREGADEIMAPARSAARKLGGGNGGECIFVHVPDNIHDEELEEELRSRIPEHPDHPDTKNVFWSSKWEDFVVRRYEEEAERAIEARYGEGKVIDKDPEQAAKPGTWKIRDEEGS